MKIVKLNNGNYAIQTGKIFKKYIDFHGNFEWYRGDEYFKDCQSTLKHCERYMEEQMEIKKKDYNIRYAKVVTPKKDALIKNIKFFLKDFIEKLK